MLFVRGGVLTFDYNDFHRHTRLTADTPLSPGAREIVLQVIRTPEGGGDASLRVDGRTVAAGAGFRACSSPSSPTSAWTSSTFSTVTDDYAAPVRLRQDPEGGDLPEILSRQAGRRRPRSGPRWPGNGAASRVVEAQNVGAASFQPLEAGQAGA